MDKQEAYDGIVTWFSQPGAELGFTPEEFGGASCVYRGNGDRASKRRCAVGCLMPDEKYRTTFEGSSVSATEITEALGLGGPEHEETRTFLSSAQSAHDEMAAAVVNGDISGDGVEEFLAKLKIHAKDFGVRV